MVWDIDSCCPKGYYLSYNTLAKVYTQDINIKNSCFKKSKAKKPKPAHIKAAKPWE